MVRKKKSDWEKLLDIFLKQADIRPPRSFWDLLHLLEESLAEENYKPKKGRRTRQMSGIQFEKILGIFFEKQGYHVTSTKKSHDKGADLLLRRPGETIVVQAKRRKDTIGVGAVQEVYTAAAYYQTNRAMVITTSKRFSRPAVKLAKRIGVELWDRQRLMQELRNH